MQKPTYEKLLVIFNTMQEGVIEQDNDGNILSWNEAALRILDMSPNDIENKSVKDPYWNAIHLDGTAYEVDKFPSMLASSTGKPQLGAIMGLNFVDGIKWIQINAVPYENETGDTHSITTFVDVTDLIERSKLLEQRS